MFISNYFNKNKCEFLLVNTINKFNISLSFSQNMFVQIAFQ